MKSDWNLAPGVGQSDLSPEQPKCVCCSAELTGEDESDLCPDCRKSDLENEGKRE